jgi:hypothetical protein
LNPESEPEILDEEIEANFLRLQANEVIIKAASELPWPFRFLGEQALKLLYRN